MKPRIPLHLIESRVILQAMVECKKLRMPKHYLRFIIDTGSPNSYLSEEEVTHYHIPMKNRTILGHTDLGGSRFRHAQIPPLSVYLLTEDDKLIPLQMNLLALKTTKESLDHIQTAQSLPSILGMGFLFEQKLSLHIIPTENLAYLQCEA